MARKKPQEDHLNHEAWAIPYGDLITLLLAFFVVMYSISSVNEGKFRVLSDALIVAFHGVPKTLSPVQLGSVRQRGSSSDQSINMMSTRAVVTPISVAGELHTVSAERRARAAQSAVDAPAAGDPNLELATNQIEEALVDLIQDGRIRVRRFPGRVEVEIATDILFSSGSAVLGAEAVRVFERIAALLVGLPNMIKVEGHTDNRPIQTVAFPSNWELSTGRAAGVVRLLAARAIDPRRLSAHGFGEFRPVASNATARGRNANRRVTLVLIGISDQGVADGPNPAGEPAQ